MTRFKPNVSWKSGSEEANTIDRLTVDLSKLKDNGKAIARTRLV